MLGAQHIVILFLILIIMCNSFVRLNGTKAFDTVLFCNDSNVFDHLDSCSLLGAPAVSLRCCIRLLVFTAMIGCHGDMSFDRLGSGSACRSVFGGFVKWERGEREDGTDSIAVQVQQSLLSFKFLLLLLLLLLFLLLFILFLLLLFFLLLLLLLLIHSFPFPPSSSS